MWTQCVPQQYQGRDHHAQRDERHDDARRDRRPQEVECGRRGEQAGKEDDRVTQVAFQEDQRDVRGREAPRQGAGHGPTERAVQQAEAGQHQQAPSGQAVKRLRCDFANGPTTDPLADPDPVRPRFRKCSVTGRRNGRRPTNPA